VPTTVEQIGESVAAAVAAGATEVHVHPKDGNGKDSLHPDHVDAVVDALRDRHPELPIGVTTGIWAARDHEHRMTQVRGWGRLPDYTSINWHEEGAEELADLLLDRGIGVEAGLWHVQAAEQFRRYPRASECLRILIEGTTQDIDEAVAEARQVLQIVKPLRLPVLLHGEGANAWALFDLAVANGLDSRIGLEDTFVLPNASAAPDNAELVRAALARTAKTQGEQ
jgi:uncharacterized protein (DUF849 family)